MQAFIKINPIDKDLFCEHIYTSYISTTSDFLSTCASAAKLLNTNIPIECYTNFRDALFHFRRMVQSNEENTISKQAFAVSEHSNRAKTDAIISILDLCNAALQIISKEHCLEPEVHKELIHIQNKMAEYVLHRRLSGVMLDQTNILSPSNDEIMIIIDDFFDFIDRNIGKENLEKALKILDDHRKSYLDSDC